ncbi:Ig-like domain-containing protein [uncultured Nitratireductor sp.]|uniref:Ig-like domain-containing protein n=1 Tax=uncultured Nitratireductor sp. TaxID=520953 RepID=UPI0025E43354|nr:Ig-like domain-containing protein [uncultured Nitratireductor sp.]
MGLTPLKGLLFLSGAVIAGFGAAYLLGAFDAQTPPSAAILSSPSPDTSTSSAQSDGEDATAAGTKEARLQEPVGKDGKNAQETLKSDPNVTPPSFDIVRVEPNGSMVIAGKAEPNARVEIVNGSTVLGTATTGASGDFAAVLDEPLEPGDYQIVLRATTSDNVAATSIETAIVTVPDDETGQVLALVDQPGAPSRLITVPEAKPPQTAETDTPARDAPKPDQTVQTPSDTQQQSATSNPEDDREATPSTAEAGTEGRQPAETARAEEPRTSPGGNAARTSSSERESRTSPFIEAVEIDGQQVFVAGAAPVGSTIRVYVNQILLGETVTAPNGRFLIEATRDLPIGDYIVRADMLSDDSSTVVARAAVPFTRAEGEQVAAVAAPNTTTDAGGDKVDTKDARLPDSGDAVPIDQSGDTGQRRTANADTEALEATATAPKLAPVDGSVIIRRGDTLWHISRRVYGRGIRYTTLYLANQDQIEDPDRIWPGQVFAVPESTEEGEAADMEAIEDQMVDPENPG